MDKFPLHGRGKNCIFAGIIDFEHIVCSTGIIRRTFNHYEKPTLYQGIIEHKIKWCILVNHLYSMRNLFLVTMATSILCGFCQTIRAQKGPAFIEGIELRPATAPVVHLAAAVTPSKPAVVSIPAKAVKNALDMEKCNRLQLKYGLMMNRELESISNIRLYSFIEDWYGTRYRYGGTTKRGVDCSSFTLQLIKAVYGLDLSRTARQQFEQTSRIDASELQEGDLVFFNTRGGISHVGVFLGDGYFVHASSSSGVMISHLKEPYFSARYKGAGRAAAPVTFTAGTNNVL